MYEYLGDCECVSPLSVQGVLVRFGLLHSQVAARDALDAGVVQSGKVVCIETRVTEL